MKLKPIDIEAPEPKIPGIIGQISGFNIVVNPFLDDKTIMVSQKTLDLLIEQVEKEHNGVMERMVKP